jgi:small GTP-binding protein
MVKRLSVEGNPVDLQIWDFGGEERFRFLLPAYCRGAYGAIFMYDITNPTSLYHVDEWLSILRSQGGKFPIIMGGTKCDLAQNRKVQNEEAQAITQRSGLLDIVEVSSKNGSNIDALFQGLCVKMMQATRPEVTVPITQKPIVPIPQVYARI